MKKFFVFIFLFFVSCSSQPNKFKSEVIIETDSIVVENKIDKFENFNLDSNWQIINQVFDTNYIIIVIVFSENGMNKYEGNILLRNKNTRELFIIDDISLSFINFENAISFQVFQTTKETLKAINKKKEYDM